MFLYYSSTRPLLLVLSFLSRHSAFRRMMTQQWRGILEFLPDYGVICCLTHQYCVSPRSLHYHLTSEKHKLKAADARDACQWKDKLSPLYEEADEVSSPSHPVPSFSCLEHPKPGLQCHKCFYITVSDKMIRSHYLAKHNYSHFSQDAKPWLNITMQSFFFRPTGRRWFQVIGMSIFSSIQSPIS